jgi:sortase A
MSDRSSALRLVSCALLAALSLATHGLRAADFPSLVAPEPALVGSIEIPRLGLNAPVREGAQEDTLRVAVGHIEGTALPGASGNAGLAAHRNTFFRPLRNVRAEDRVLVKTAAGTRAYRVSSIQVVAPEDVWVLNPTAGPTLTLVTCYPFDFVGDAPRRLIVRAVAETE